jgi:outer membrane protein insertion porin family
MSKSEKDSERRRKKRSRTYFFLAAMVAFFWLKTPGAAADLPGSPPISRVFLLIDGQPADKEMADLISLREGDTFSLEKITRIIKQIYKTGLFSDVRVSRSDETGIDGIALTFSLTRNLVVRKIIFVGDREIPRKKLREGLSDVRQGRFFVDDDLGKAVEELKIVLRQEGCYEPEIKASAAKNPNSSSVDISFKILSWKKFRIKAIFFEGEALVPVSGLKNRMKSREGRDYVPLTLEQDLVRIKEYYIALGYQRAEIGLGREDFDEQEKTVSLSLNISPQEKIKIVINGAKVPVKLLAPIWEERIFEEWGLAEGEARILGFLRNQGYLFASLTSRLEKAGNEIRAIYDVSPGERYKIQNILFEGLKYFTSSRIKSEVGITEKIPLFSWINGQRLFEVPEEIELLYQANGFPDTQVTLNFIKKGNKVSAVFSVEEGIQQRIKTLTFSGASLLSPDELRTQISSTAGGPFFSPNIQGEIEKLETFYLNRGIRGTKVTSEVQPAGDNLFALAYHISEGAEVHVEKIVIAGNTATRRSIIERELRVGEGQPAYYELILETKRRLENLGVFSEVKIEEIPVSAGAENLVINLSEGERNYAGLGVGLETKNEPHTFVLWDNVIRLRGTAEYIRTNLFGTASQLSLVSQFSLKEKRGVIALLFRHAHSEQPQCLAGKRGKDKLHL